MIYLPNNAIISGDAGHNAIGDSGAVGIKREDDLTKELWKCLQSKLSNIGYSVVDCTPWGKTFNNSSESLDYRVTVANDSKSNIHLCVHFNKTLGGTGVECYTVLGGTSEKYGRQICEEISKALNIKNRGVKDGGRFYIPKYTNMPCVLIEVCFIDNQEDMNKYNVELTANAIIKAVTGKIVPVQEVTPTKYYVVSNYLPSTSYGIEIMSLFKYFKDINIERLYIDKNEHGQWLVTQYLKKEDAQLMADRLDKDGLLYQLMIE